MRLLPFCICSSLSLGRIAIMHIRFIVIGKLKNASLRALQGEYVKRIERSARIEMIELKDAPSVVDEGQRLIKALERIKVGRCYALSEEGKMYSSRGFAQLIERDYAGSFNFVIGGPYGLADEVRASCNGCISLSKMTFTHEFARVLALEQIYRALEIQRGSGYHH